MQRFSSAICRRALYAAGRRWIATALGTGTLTAAVTTRALPAGTATERGASLLPFRRSSSRRRWASFSTPRSSRCSNSPTMFGPPSRSHSPMSCSTELTAISKQLCYDRRMTVSRLDIGRGPPNHDEALRAAPYSR